MIPQINWKSSALVEEFRQGFCDTGFIRLYNIWDDDQSQTINQWFTAVETWFYEAEDKDQWTADQDAWHGWVDVDTVNLNPRSGADHKQCFEIGHFDDPQLLPPIYRQAFADAYPLIHSLALEVIETIEQVLECPKNSLVSVHKNTAPHMMRTAYYPASEARKNQLPCGEHKDYNTVTLLFSPDEHKRLQIKTRDGEWKSIEFMENSVVINIGVLLQVWSQDYLNSAFHRVLWNEKDAFTTAYFCSIPNNTLLSPIGPAPRKYPDMTAGTFLKRFQKSKEVIRFKSKHNEQ